MECANLRALQHFEQPDIEEEDHFAWGKWGEKYVLVWTGPHDGIGLREVASRAIDEFREHVNRLESNRLQSGLNKPTRVCCSLDRLKKVLRAMQNESAPDGDAEWRMCPDVLRPTRMPWDVDLSLVCTQQELVLGWNVRRNVMGIFLAPLLVLGFGWAMYAVVVRLPVNPSAVAAFHSTLVVFAAGTAAIVALAYGAQVFGALRRSPIIVIDRASRRVSSCKEPSLVGMSVERLIYRIGSVRFPISIRPVGALQIGIVTEADNGVVKRTTLVSACRSLSKRPMERIFAKLQDCGVEVRKVDALPSEVARDVVF